MAGINPYSLTPPRVNAANANPFGTQSVMPQSNMPVMGTTTSSFSTLQNVQPGATGAPTNQMNQQLGVPAQGPLATRGLLSSQMRPRPIPGAPSIQPPKERDQATAMLPVSTY